jgi:hypothetical protein
MRRFKKYRNSTPQSTDGELWYRIPGFEPEEVYISEVGNVVCNGRLCKPNYCYKGGYGHVHFLKGRYKIHRLVGYVIVGERDLHGLIPHHINGNPQDNRFANIRLVSPEMNAWFAQTKQLINNVIRSAMEQNPTGFAYLSEVPQKYLEDAFLQQQGDEEALANVFSEYVQDKEIHIQSPTDRTVIGLSIDTSMGYPCKRLKTD